MRGAARRGDVVTGGVHCHGHSHAPPETRGRLITGAARVFIQGRPAARAGDLGHSPLCCGGRGRIQILPTTSKVLIEGSPAAGTGDATLHCDMAPGVVKGGSRKVFIP